MPRKQIVALAAAIALSVATAGTAVAVNLRATADMSPSPAGRLTAAESATSAPVSSTVVVDVTVPDLPPVTDGSGAPAPAAVQSSGGKVADPSDDDGSEDRRESPVTQREGSSDDD